MRSKKQKRQKKHPKKAIKRPTSWMSAHWKKVVGAIVTLLLGGGTAWLNLHYNRNNITITGNNNSTTKALAGSNSIQTVQSGSHNTVLYPIDSTINIVQDSHPPATAKELEIRSLLERYPYGFILFESTSAGLSRGLMYVGSRPDKLTELNLGQVDIQQRDQGRTLRVAIRVRYTDIGGVSGHNMFMSHDFKNIPMTKFPVQSFSVNGSKLYFEVLSKRHEPQRYVLGCGPVEEF